MQFLSSFVSYFLDERYQLPMIFFERILKHFDEKKSQNVPTIYKDHQSFPKFQAFL